MLRGGTNIEVGQDLQVSRASNMLMGVKESFKLEDPSKNVYQSKLV